MENSSSDQPRSYSKTAHESHLDLLDRGTLSDVAFIVGPNKERIPSHQAFLITRSPVFDAMFSERWNHNNTKEIPLEDMDPKIFKKFLQFIYADTIVANVPETLDLLQVAHFYDVQLLVSRCEELLLEKEVTLDDAVDVFRAAQKYDKIQLMDKAGDLMAKSLSELQNHASFSRLDKEILAYILKRDCLSMREVDLFRLAVKWAQIQDDGLTLEQSLEDILPLIRFPTMTPEEFTDTVRPSGLLSQSTLVEVYAYFGTNAENKKSLASALKFNTQRRRSTDPIHYYDLYPGVLARKETELLYLHKIKDYLEIRARITGTAAMGISGISLCCPARAVSAASGPVSPRFKEFSVVLRTSISVVLLSMSPVKIEEGKMTEIKFDTVIPLTNNYSYYILVKEIPRSSRQPGGSTENYHFVEVFGRPPVLTLQIINECVVIEGTDRNRAEERMDDDRPQLICRLGLEKL